MLDALVDREVSDEVRAMLLDRSGGNPFFLEELVALVADADLADPGLLAGVGALGDLPDTLARAGGRSPRRPRARPSGPAWRTPSVWGRSGPAKALAMMAEVIAGHHRLRARCWHGLDDKEILQVDGDHWVFRSDLIREVAYGTLTKADRARRHHGIAAYLARPR